MDENLRRRFASYLSQGRVILFTGAGFSLAAKSVSGDAIPSAETLTKALWELAFPGVPYDGSSLGDVYEAASSSAGGATKRLMESQLTVDHRTLPSEYRLWFAYPWYRIYTLNVDDLEEAAERAFDLPRPILPVSALTDAHPVGAGAALTVIHLNGRVKDLPNVTFSSRQYGERLAAPDLWYDNLVRELQSHSVLYVGTSLDEPPLWQYVEARGRRRPGRELRPGSFIVVPHLPLARRVGLSQYNISWVEDTFESVTGDLGGLAEDADTGLRALAGRTVPRDEEILIDVAAVRNDSADDEREFLMGREPRWSDISQHGYAVVRAFDNDLVDTLGKAHMRIVLLTGTAGSGKSTSAMRLALGQLAEGQRAYVLNPDSHARFRAIRSAVHVSDADFLLIDNAERFGSSLASLLRELSDAKPDMLVVAALRSGPYERFGLSEALGKDDDVLELTVPNLEDSDIDALIAALDSANRLGALRGKSQEEQREAFRRKFDRQLLVAMIEVTTGTRFGEKVDSECRELEGSAGLVYAVAALASHHRASLTDQEVLTACSGEPAAVLGALSGLLRRHLLVRDKRGAVTLRHKVIADRALEFYRNEGQLAEALRGLMFSLATSSRPGRLRESRQGRLLIHLLSHERLMALLYRTPLGDVDRAAVREVYEGVEALLENDYHYWLQRGSFETEEGDLGLATNFVEQAKVMAPDDPFVRTQWAYTTLKRASRNPVATGALDDVSAAFEELADVIAIRGKHDHYPYHVYGSQGLAWLNRGPLSRDEKVALMDDLRRVVGDGLDRHPDSRILRKLAGDLQHEYLMLATA